MSIYDKIILVKNNIIFFACILLFAMLIWFATSVAMSYNNYSQTENAVSSYEDDDGIPFIFDFHPIEPEVLL